MTTLTYVKGLPAPEAEMNCLGLTDLEMLLNALAPIFHAAACETVSKLLKDKNFDKSKWNTHWQTTYLINERHANGVISFAQAQVDSAVQCRKLHIKTLQGKLRSTLTCLSKSEKKLKLAQRFYAKKQWESSKIGCNFQLFSYLDTRRTNWQSLKFQLHQKKRKAAHLKDQLVHLKTKPIQVKIPRNQIFFAGSKDERLGNQVCQWDREVLKFRVPYCLESKFGLYVSTSIGNFDRKLNRLPASGAKTWHFFYKNHKWNVAVQFTPSLVNQRSRPIKHGCLGLDLNPGKIGWSYVDGDGNLKACGQILLQMGLPKGSQDAQIVDACLTIADLANTYACPVVCENLDFTEKKEQLREKGRVFARMLSGWAYSKFDDLLSRILGNRGIQVVKVNPAYALLIINNKQQQQQIDSCT